MGVWLWEINTNANLTGADLTGVIWSNTSQVLGSDQHNSLKTQ
jgi:hypothetical protein